MTGEFTNSQKLLLAAAIAEGTAVAMWASSNAVPERTAYRWAAEPEVRSGVPGAPYSTAGSGFRGFRAAAPSTRNRLASRPT